METILIYPFTLLSYIYTTITIPRALRTCTLLIFPYFIFLKMDNDVRRAISAVIYTLYTSDGVVSFFWGGVFIERLYMLKVINIYPSLIIIK